MNDYEKSQGAESNPSSAEEQDDLGSYRATEEKNGVFLAEQIMRMLNMFGGGHANEAFMNHMTTNHRTLQQRFTAFCFVWIKICAEKEKSKDYDLRNEASVKLCRKIVDQFGDQMYLPFI